MGTTASTTNFSSEWKVNITLQKGATLIDYTLISNSDVMTKKITGASNPISFTVNPNDSQMKHESVTDCGSDGDIEDLRTSVKGMILKLNQLLEDQLKEEV
jgi:hypothetical protein